jgi:streptogramin lyase
MPPDRLVRRSVALVILVGLALAAAAGSSESPTRTDAAGAVTRFGAGLDALQANDDVAVGPDGNVWFTDQAAHQIGEITPSGQVTFVPLGPQASPTLITTGPDGNIWFTDGPNLDQLQIDATGDPLITEWLAECLHRAPRQPRLRTGSPVCALHGGVL